MGATRCPFFHCTNVKRNGVRNGRQRYTCLTCSRSWSSKHRPDRKAQKLWRQYAFEGRTVANLAKEYRVGQRCIRTQLTAYIPPRIIQKPRTVAIIMDVTYIDGWGILVVIDPAADPKLDENTILYYAVLESTERTSDYEVATDTIEAMGYSILMATIDGRRGVQHMLEA